jgi:hypothetical protein
MSILDFAGAPERRSAGAPGRRGTGVRAVLPSKIAPP